MVYVQMTWGTKGPDGRKIVRKGKDSKVEGNMFKTYYMLA